MNTFVKIKLSAHFFTSLSMPSILTNARMHDIIGCAALLGQIVSWHSQQISTQLLLALCDFLMSINGTTIFNISSLKMFLKKIDKTWGNRTNICLIPSSLVYFLISVAEICHILQLTIGSSGFKLTLSLECLQVYGHSIIYSKTQQQKFRLPNWRFIINRLPISFRIDHMENVLSILQENI